MSRQKELTKNMSILSIGALVPKIIALFITPILTTQLTKTEYGIYDLITTIVSLLFPAVTLEITTAAFRFLIEKKNNLRESRIIISTLYAFVLLMIVAVSSFFIFFIGDRIGNKFLVLLYFILDIMLIATEQILRGLGKNILYSLSYIIRSITSLLFTVLLLGTLGTPNFGLDGLLIAMVVSTGLALIVIFVMGKIKHYISLKAVSYAQLKIMLAYSWPMVPNNLSGWVLRLSDRLVITGALGLEMNAVYAVANKLPTLFQVFQSTFSLAWQENASLAIKDKDKGTYYSRMINAISDMLIGVMVLLLATTPLLFKVLIRGDYQQAYNQLPVLYGGMIFSCMAATLGGLYIAYKKTVSVGISTMVAAVINLVIDVLFVNIIGIWAGSISTLISYIVLWIYRIRNVQKFQKIDYNYKRLFMGILFISLSCALFYMHSIYANIGNIILTFIVLWVFDKEIILMLLKMLRNKSKN